MVQWSGEEMFEGLEKWLKTRRDDYQKESSAYIAVDDLLDELREAAAEGWFPWQRLGEDDDTQEANVR